MMKSFVGITVALATLIAATAVSAQEGAVQSPALKVGDAWIFDDVVENGPAAYNETRLNYVVERLGVDTMTVGVKREGAPTSFEDHIVGMDWSFRQIVDGQEAVTDRPFEFPMNVGRQWTVDYVDSTRRGNQLSLHVHRTYSVSGWVDITVPAGHFHAIEVIADGVDEGIIEVPAMAGSTAVASSGGTASVSHAQRGGTSKKVVGIHIELYYVPGVKNLARSIVEQYNTDNVRVSRKTRNLISFTPAA